MGPILQSAANSGPTCVNYELGVGSPNDLSKTCAECMDGGLSSIAKTQLTDAFDAGSKNKSQLSVAECKNGEDDANCPELIIHNHQCEVNNDAQMCPTLSK